MRRLTTSLLTVAVTCAAAVASTSPARAHPADAERLSSADLSLALVERLRGDLVPDSLLAELPERAKGNAETTAFELVGHSPLRSRGMNSGLAVHEGYAYIGSRSDGTHADAGVLIVDVRDPKTPRDAGEISLPEQALPTESSRELRVLPDQDVLLVLNHGCSELIHRCANPALVGGASALLASNIKFYDISTPGKPVLKSTYRPSRSAPQSPHEFFVWTDPEDPDRILVYETTPSSNATREQLIVTDVSRWRDGVFTELHKWVNRLDPAGPSDKRLHSLTVTPDGRRAYLAYLGGGFLVADTTDFAKNVPAPVMRLVTRPEDRVYWTNPGAHSAIKVPGKPYAMTTDEVYGEIGGLFPDHGCPWGWVRFIDVHNEAKPRIASEYRLPVNDPDACAEVDPVRNNLSSFSAHNPTLTRNLAFVTWHSAGFQAIDISDPTAPAKAGEFVPAPLPFVQTEDPALSSGMDKVVMWSFPVIVDGLIYVVDLRNGLYVLKYRGEHAEEVRKVTFLDGNTNSGDALRLEGPG